MPNDDVQSRAEQVFTELIEDALATGKDLEVEPACRKHPELASALRLHAIQYRNAMDAFDALPALAPPGLASAGDAHQWVGKRIGDFEVVRELGRGGMGVVFLARQVSLGREVALKILPPQLAAIPQYVSRFKREASVIARLSHGNAVAVHSAGEAEGYLYIATDYVQYKVTYRLGADDHNQCE